MRSLFLAPLLVLSSVCFGQDGPCNNQTSVTYQGYEYDIVEIAGNCWFQENLQTYQYSNGENINTDGDWLETDQGLTNGQHYNLWAVQDERGLCPSGWHVSTYDDWSSTLSEFTNYSQANSCCGWYYDIAHHYKSQTWDEGANTTGLTATSVGFINPNGNAGGGQSQFWASGPTFIAFYNNNNDVGKGLNNPQSGSSVRCVTTQLIVSTSGCTDPTASNYDPEATEDDGSCCYAEWGDEWVQIGQDIDGESIDDQSGSFGSVSISSNGNIIIVGGRYNDENGDQTGHVRIYEFIDGTWGQIGEDINGENNGEYFGWSTSMSDNGDIVAVANKSSNGIVKIYENNDGVWEQMGGDIIDDTFIESISLNEDGSIVSIGLYEGYVSVYQYSGDAWNQLGGDILLPESSQNCENSISLNNPGDIIAIGVSQNDDNSSNSGNTKCYSFNGNSWNQLGQDLYGESEGDYSGCSVSLSNSGNILAIGASRNTDNGLDAGHVRVYELINISGNTYEWIQVGMDIDGNSLERSGLAISLNGEGDFVAIGSPGNGTGGNAQGGGVGYVRIYNFIDGSWAQIGENLVGEYSADGSGRSVNLSVDGSTVAIGAPWNYVSELGGSNQFGTNNAGHVRVYEISTPCDNLLGCTIEQACNFNPEAIEDDGSCLFAGESCDDGDEATLNDSLQEDCSCSGEAICTGSECCTAGTQWDLNTMSCVYDDECPTDIDKDGFVAVSDLLFLLSGYGTSCDAVSWGIGGENCQGAECCGVNTLWCESLEICIPLTPCGGDLNGDLAIGVDDLLTFLITYGTTCENFENIIICEACLGVFDECGVCDGPGATEVVIENITILYDSLYAEVIDEWWVFEIGADTTFSYTCPGLCGDAIEHEGYNYSTVLIGDQCWFAENLRTTHYSNGDSIPGDFSVDEWDDLPFNIGARAIYPNGESNLADYGRLYNWYAVEDARGLCPSGWHVPTDVEWTTLTDMLGGSQVAGGKMKSSPEDSPSWNGTNESGFSGLAGGYIGNGAGLVGIDGFFWSTSEWGDYAWYRRLLGNYSSVNRNSGWQSAGYSVRCLKDTE